ncbi:hypothetical protein PUNSTDRAFT_141476 [Punctularia strigosozonata HHB-11173 SS5]|uniref:uncharacterized protein n=1 Tax=Punctularia strigosozonata (strain HHB-11173) TaxID=741275 RepID=UPI0004417EF3|nr:uncharacterized protein PUNSTDRAFT_141476 [Punctularia strigosozonata HHB-11173 SS5]EIN12915.1 hypothetical protein PUNSTDRAFT_141476 [Punctularia strigosozonata HHB-11173 SS5]
MAEDKDEGPDHNTVRGRLAATLREAQSFVDQSKATANLTGWGLTVVLFTQIAVGAVITLLSAIDNSRRGQISTAVLGAISTIISGYLAKVRHQDEPQKSERRHADLCRLIRTMDNYIDDYGDDPAAAHMADVNRFRARLEDILSRDYDADKDGQGGSGSGVPGAGPSIGANVKGSMDKARYSEAPPPPFREQAPPSASPKTPQTPQTPMQSQAVPSPPPATIRKVGKFVKADRRDRDSMRRNDSLV